MENSICNAIRIIEQKYVKIKDNFAEMLFKKCIEGVRPSGNFLLNIFFYILLILLISIHQFYN